MLPWRNIATEESMERKIVRGEIKEAAEGATEGRVVARIATFNAKDADGDITLPGAFGEQTVPMVYGHDWLSMPIGKGRIYEEGDSAIFDGQFNLDIEAGREAFASVKFMGDLQEWSYGYEVKDYEMTKDARILKSLGVKEASPVLVGAGSDTQTLLVKSRDNTMNLIEVLANNGDEAAKDYLEAIEAEGDKDDGLKFAEEVERAVVTLERLASRAEEIKSLREEKGGNLGGESVDGLTKVNDRIGVLLTSVEAGPVDVDAEFLHYQETMARVNGEL
jgi:hypothetical protein